MKQKIILTGSDGYKVFLEIKSDILPSIGDLINQLIVRGKSEDEIRTAVQTAARSYKALVMAFIGQDQTKSPE
ncbi:hypothetical protein SB6413_02220 [Klebsiella pasteurii]|uniref:hypothetical protein n=1 Tax=Klebsiella pasteurii TaxID=2587529 RepID=UPI00115CA502|nr:hypothetical protein [Klebsiella pasteurii]VUT17252.1 hypothetical protein SB6413_02220 [Klebsiella pasteurii]